MSARKSPKRPRPPASPLDRFALYELCAQNPPRDARLLHAIYADQPGRLRRAPILGEDFCGTAALSRAWCELLPGSHAVAVDIDRPTLARAPRHARVSLVHADVRAVRSRVDLIAVLNFSICELHARRDLVAYLAHARARLRPRGRLVCDLYGGSDAFITGRLPQSLEGPLGERIRYTWEQRAADPLTGRVVNAMHFQVHPRRGRGLARRFHDAFVYDWRLWSVPELREAMLEAGFAGTEVYPRTPGAIDQSNRFHVEPVTDPLELSGSFNVLVVGDQQVVDRAAQ